MRPNVSAVPFVPMSMKPIINHGRRGLSGGPTRKISAGKPSVAFAEAQGRYKTVRIRTLRRLSLLLIWYSWQELCRQFDEMKECEYGDRCLFAHSILELKVCWVILSCRFVLKNISSAISHYLIVIPNSERNPVWHFKIKGTVLLDHVVASYTKKLTFTRSCVTLWRTCARINRQKRSGVCPHSKK